MSKNEILALLEKNHMQFIDYLNALSLGDYEFSAPEKWSAGQQLNHIVLSVRPLALGFILPKFILKLFFGKANRPSKSYEALVAKYTEKLKQGGRATAAFTPKKVYYSGKSDLIAQLHKHLRAIGSHLENYTEYDLDEMILPHPLLGKITVREMLYFTAHHVNHHHLLAGQYLKHQP